MRLFISSIILSMFFTKAFADSDDLLNLKVHSNYLYDDNLFRLAPERKPAGANTKRWDNIFTTEIGFDVNKKYSLQTFKLNYHYTDQRHENSSFLDYGAHQYKGEWLWSVTPHLNGNIIIDRSVALLPFLDYRVSNVRNLRTTDSRRFDLDWSLHDNWHLLAAYMNLESINSQTFLAQTSTSNNIFEGGLRYLLPSSSSLTLKYRNIIGQNQAINFSSYVGKEYMENQVEMAGFWSVSGKLKLTSLFGYTDRKDDTFALRSYSGFYGGVNMGWAITSKLNLEVDYTRKILPFLLLTSSYTTYDILTIRPTWLITSKLAARANGQIGQRNFAGSAPNSSAFQRSDDSLSFGFSMDWRPQKSMTLGFNLQHDERASNLTGISYSDNTAQVDGKLAF